MIDYFKKIINAAWGNSVNYKYLRYLHTQAWNDYKSSKVNLGQLQGSKNLEHKNVKNLSNVEFQVFSQFGDDGIIHWLTHQLPLPFKTFIEFGVENYRESNTRFLLINDYWSGLVIDGDNAKVNSIKGEQMYTFYDLQAECSFITRDNINEIIKSSKFNEQLGLLSIDIDGNDYWIWQAIDSVRPAIIVCEYNCLFGFEHPYTIPYAANFVRGTGAPFNFYGTSLKSACDLAASRGYGFIGCNSAGNNAYFILNNYLKYLTLPVLTPEEGYVFSCFTESWDQNGIPLRGLDKIRSIDKLPVVNTISGVLEKVDSAGIINSLVAKNKLNRF